MADFIMNLGKVIGGLFSFAFDLLQAFWAAAVLLTLVAIVASFVLSLVLPLVKRIYKELTKSR